MKKESNIIQKILFYIIGVLAVILVAVMIRKGYTFYQDGVKQEELKVRYQEVQSDLDDIQMQIKKLSGDSEALQQFLDEEIIDTNIIQEEESIPSQKPQEEVQEVISDSVISEEKAEDTNENETVSVTGNEQPSDLGLIVIPEKAKPEEEQQQESVSDNDTIVVKEEPVIMTTISGNESEQEEPVSANEIRQDTKEDTISGNAVVNGEVIPFHYENKQSSYVDTMQINGEDRARIANSHIDFSDIKIACLGDSLTAASNLENMENYENYSYPSVLKGILDIEEVYNLGIGGSSYGRYWDEAFVDRYKDIPEDTDIILVMGGTNDGFAASADELGNIKDRKRRTFYGDVDELMKGLKKDYPNTKIFFVTPLPNVLQDYLMKQRDYLLPQSAFVNAIKELAAEYQIQVIDLYHSNLLDTHDAQVISTYMPDGVHGNPAGYQVMAEHFASEIIKTVEKEGLYPETISGNSSFEDSISGNALTDESISGNSVIDDTMTDHSISNNSSADIENDNKEKQENKEEIISEEEKQRIQENNKKIAEDAMIITPQPIEVPQEETQTTNDDIPEQEEPQVNYQYQGEAIIVQ